MDKLVLFINHVFSGPLITANFTHTNATNLTTESNLFGPNYFYGLEVALVTICFLIGITVNLLLGNAQLIIHKQKT